MKKGFLVTLIMLLPQFGCSTAFKQAYYEVRGAKGEFVSNRGARPAALSSYQAINFRRAHSDIGGRLVPQNLLSTFDTAAANVQTKLGNNGTQIDVDTNILFYEGKGLLDSAFLLAHVKFFGGGSVIDEGMVKVISKSFRAGDPEDMAKKAAETIAEYALGRTGGLFGDDDGKDDRDNKD